MPSTTEAIRLIRHIWRGAYHVVYLIANAPRHRQGKADNTPKKCRTQLARSAISQQRRRKQLMFEDRQPASRCVHLTGPREKTRRGGRQPPTVHVTQRYPV